MKQNALLFKVYLHVNIYVLTGMVNNLNVQVNVNFRILEDYKVNPC